MGYSPFEYMVDSDHRAAIISFETKKLFGDDVDLLAPSQFRGVRTQDRKSTTTFIEKLYDHLLSNNAFELQKRLDSDIGPPSLLETLDALVGQGGDSADKACRRRRPEFYSQRLVQQRAMVGAYRSLVRGLRQGTDRQIAISSRLARKHIQIECPPTLPMAVNKYKEAVALLCEIQKEHTPHRCTDLISQLSLAKTPNHSAILKQYQQLRKLKDIEPPIKLFRQ